MQHTDTPEMRQARVALGARLWRIPERGFPDPAGDRWPDLATMQEFVGGYIEHLAVGYEGQPSHMIVNEDGHRLALPVNEIASAIAGRVIVGPALLWVGPLPEGA
jgi:hypothetical protein